MTVSESEESVKTSLSLYRNENYKMTVHGNVIEAAGIPWLQIFTEPLTAGAKKFSGGICDRAGEDSVIEKM